MSDDAEDDKIEQANVGATKSKDTDAYLEGRQADYGSAGEQAAEGVDQAKAGQAK